MRPLLVYSFMFVAFIYSAFAMDSYSFAGFTTIDTTILEDLTRNEPHNAGLTDGQLQCWNMLAWAHYRDGFELPLEYLQIPKTTFRLYSPPTRLAAFINERLPYTCRDKAQIIGHKHLDEQGLMLIIKKQIEQQKPLLIYYVKNDRIRLATIVGYKHLGKNTEQSHILIKNSEHPIIQSWPISELLYAMDLSSILEILQSGRDYRHYFKDKKHFDLLMDLVHELYNFTLMLFTPPPHKRPNQLAYCQLL